MTQALVRLMSISTLLSSTRPGDPVMQWGGGCATCDVAACLALSHRLGDPSRSGVAHVGVVQVAHGGPHRTPAPMNHSAQAPCG